MIARIVSLLSLALLVTAVHAQDVNWTVVLHAAGGGSCLPLQTETINGQPFNLSNGAGMSMQICPFVYNNSSDYGYITAQVPPTQPWAPDGSWYAWTPTLADTQRGTSQATNSVWYFTQNDSFDYTRDFDFFGVWVQTWHGVLNRTLLLHEKCGRYPCKNYVPYPSVCGVPHNLANCTVSFTDVADTLTLTGTFPVPTAPATVSSLYRCGSDRKACLLADGGGPHCPRDLPNCKP